MTDFIAGIFVGCVLAIPLYFFLHHVVVFNIKIHKAIQEEDDVQAKKISG